MPFHVIAGELGIWCSLGLLGDRADMGWAIDWLLRAGDIGQPGEGHNQLQSFLSYGVSDGRTYCCFAQLNILWICFGIDIRGMRSCCGVVWSRFRLYRHSFLVLIVPHRSLQKL